MKIVNKFLKLLILSLSSIFFLACNIGLGASIDLTAPILTILTPENNATVPQVVKVSGTALDDDCVKSITISIEETGQLYRLYDQQWQVNLNNEWKSYAAGTSTGTKKELSWTVDIPVTGAVSAQTFTLVIKATDNMNNEGKSSKDERYITVDISEPEVYINYPVITKTYAEAKSKSDSYSLCDNNVLQNLVNQNIEISGYQKEDVKLETLYIYVDEKENDTLPSTDEEITDYVIKRKVNADSLRNWSETILESDLSNKYKIGKHLFRLITESHDSAGNIERKVQGWFTYWNAADAPWVTGDFGYDSLEHIEKNVYPSCDLQGYAYDDDGIKSIEIEVYKLDESVNPNEWNKITEKSKTIDLSSNNYPTFYNWKVTALAESCKFKVVAKCTDVNGLESVSSIERFMQVSDVNPPQITITSANEKSLFGDSRGNFTIDGYVIDDDKDHKPSLTLVWIKDDTNQSKYVNTSYEGWTQDLSSTTGDKRFVIPLDDSSSESVQYYDDFSIGLNLFTDLGISTTGNSLNTLNFALLAVDNGNQTSTLFVSFAGDVEKPKLTIDSITVDNGTTYKFKDETREGSLKLPPFKRDENNAISSKVVLKGTWSDDSTNIWKDTSKIGKVNITWTNYSDPINVIMNSDGTWTSQEIIPPDSSTASITAELIDIGKNKASVSECFNINISQPELVRLSAKTTDGSYHSGAYTLSNNSEFDGYIYLTMEFNKAVIFKDGSEYPQLKLNVGNNKYAEYFSGNETAVHIYRYEVGTNDNCSKLKIDEIVSNSNNWYDNNAQDTKVTNIAIPTVAAYRLEGNRNIILDTTEPSVTSVSPISSNGSYKKDAELYFSLTFNEPVTLSDPTQIKLIFDDNIESESAIVTGPKNILFKYKILKNDKAEPLNLKTVDFGTCSIKDESGNLLSLQNNKFTVSQNPCNGIVIDTKSPEKPVISFVTADVVGNGETVYKDSVQVKIEYKEDDTYQTITKLETDVHTQKKYSTDNGVTYSGYTGPFTISTNGTYNIKAYQVDQAGNDSRVDEDGNAISETVKTFTLDSGNILTSITSSLPNGTYTTSETIDFSLTFRKVVKAENTSLILVDAANESNANFADKEATYVSSSNSSDGKTTTVIYKYIVSDGDSCEQLNVKSVSGTLKDSKNADIDSDYYDFTEGSSFLDNRNGISIVTGKPKISSFTWNGTDTLKITYDRKINKGDGEIKFVQNSKKSKYKVPAVISESKFNSISGLDLYYTLETNGASSDGVPSTEKKYVLNYTEDDDNASIVKVFKDAGDFEVAADIGSKCISVNNNVLTVTLNSTTGKVLPVLGVYYDVLIPEGFVSDDLGHECDKDEQREVFRMGLESPYVRVQKSSGGASYSNSATKISQPLTTGVKISCRSSDATISYQLKSSEQSTTTFAKGTTLTYVNRFNSKNFDAAVKSSSITLGSDIDYNKGVSILIKAIATDEVNTGSKDKADNRDGNNYRKVENYEAAFRTVILLQDGFDTDDNSIKEDYTQAWIRGGDSVNGGVITPGFPLSFDAEDRTKIKAMNKYTDTNPNLWYWVSWELSTALYPQFVYGDLPNSAEVSNGPSKWVWTCQAFVPNKKEYPIYPGESVTFQTGESGYGQYSKLTCYAKHCEYWDAANNKVVKSKKTE